MNTSKITPVKTLKAGLEIYETYNQWQEKDGALYFAGIGIIISGRMHEADTAYNKNWQNKFVGELQLTYIDPDKKMSETFYTEGTFGITIFAANSEDFILQCENYLNKNFEGLKEYYREADETGRIVRKVRKRTPKNTQTNRQIGKIAGCIEYAFRQSHKNKSDRYEFRDIGMESLTGEDAKMRDYYINRSNNRRNTDIKYQNKLQKSFLNQFGFTLKSVVFNFKFCLHSFEANLLKTKGIGKEEGQKLKEVLTDKEFRTIQKAFRYYNF